MSVFFSYRYQPFLFFISISQSLCCLLSVFATASPGLQPEQFDQEEQRAGVAYGETDPDLSTCRGQSQWSFEVTADLYCLFLFRTYTVDVLWLMFNGTG